MDRLLENKIALVTGGSSGIGRSSAIKLASAGAKVVIADVNKVGGEETLDLIHKEGGESVFIYTDVSQPSQVEKLVIRAVEMYGRLDYAHNNAGILGEIGPIVECSVENWERVIATNLTGVWLSMKYELSVMLKQRQGVIVNTSSVFGLRATGKGIDAYIASKHGINGVTIAVAREYAKKRIRINAICPGKIATPMQAQFSGLARGRKPEQIGEIVVWLCSDRAMAFNGCIYTDVEWLEQMRLKRKKRMVKKTGRK
jgi:NAD(P)-dependent dehydrogenase (short-subunit alcohol dehydrogenase family)